MAEKNKEDSLLLYQKEGMDKIMLEDRYIPPKEIIEFISEVYWKYNTWKINIDSTLDQFNNDSLRNWLSDSRKKFWGFIPVNFDKDRPNFFVHETRIQILNALSKIAGLKQVPVFDGIEGLDKVLSIALNDIYDYYQRTENQKMKNILQYLYAIENGTVVVFNGLSVLNKKQRNITRYDIATGEVSFKKKDVKDIKIKETIVPLEDFVVPKIWEPDIQEQNELIWRTIMKKRDFKAMFGGYENSEYVYPGNQFSDQSFVQRLFSPLIFTGDFIEVIRYFDVIKDRFGIIANGVLLNPVGKEHDQISPLPTNKKILPFAKTVFEYLDPMFFYGMSLPQKVKSPQEAINTMMEFLIDRENKSINAPILTTDLNIEDGTDLEYKANKVYRVGTTDFKELKPSAPTADYFQTISQLENIMMKTGQSSPVSFLPTRQPKSASENLIQARNQSEISGLNVVFFQDLLEQKAYLILSLFLQFYTSSKIKKILGRKKFDNIISLEHIDLHSGGLGKRITRFTDKPHSNIDLAREAILKSMTEKEKIEIIEISPDALEDLDFDIKINFEMEKTPEIERALFNDFLQALIQVDSLSVQKGEKSSLDPVKIEMRLFEKWGENPSDYLDDDIVYDDYESLYGQKKKQEQSGAGGFTNPNQPQINELLNRMPQTQNIKQAVQRGPMYGQKSAMALNPLLQK